MHSREWVEAEIKKVADGLLAYSPQKVILFGSMARGDFHEGSDIDLLIVKETERRFIDRIGDALNYIDSKLPVEPLVYTESELRRMIENGNDFIATVLGEGRVLIEQ